MNEANNRMKRRDYLQRAAAGAVLIALGQGPAAVAKDKDKNKDKDKDDDGDERAKAGPARAGAPAASKLSVCDACGHVEFNQPPEFCPVCHTEERFRDQGDVFSSAKAKSPNGARDHIPVIRVNGKPTFVSDVPCKEVQVRVGEIMHPSEKANHIHFIDFYLDGVFFTRFFASPQMQPAVVLFVREKASRIRAVSYCSQHGFWQAETAL